MDLPYRDLTTASVGWSCPKDGASKQLRTSVIRGRERLNYPDNIDDVSNGTQCRAEVGDNLFFTGF